jgi:hypothetical protein
LTGLSRKSFTVARLEFTTFQADCGTTVAAKTAETDTGGDLGARRFCSALLRDREEIA